MKFYYNGKLIRTSKSHTYTHAVIDTVTGGCKGCRASKETAEAIISTEVAYYEKKIGNYKNAVKALQNGKSGYYAKDGRRTYYSKFSADSTVERYNEWIGWDRNYINSVKANWQVVELEARA